MVSSGPRVATQASIAGSPSTAPAFYRPELDVLRFFAFFGVFLAHSLSNNPSIYLDYGLPRPVADLLAATAKAGSFGVTLFFTLSAYLISSLLLREKNSTQNVNLRSFYIRRILRIWPLYFFMLAVASVWPFSSMRMPVPYLLAYLFLAGNWMTVLFGAPHTFASILWSVSIEEQFYLSWPLAVKRFSRLPLMRVAFALLIIANAVRIWLATRPLQEDTVWPNTFAQLDSIALGIIAAISFDASVPKYGVRWRIALAVAGISVFLIVGHYSRASAAFTIFGYPAAALACLALLLAICGSSVSNPFLVYLGKISYGLYVFHAFSLYLVGMLLHGKTGSVARYAIYWGGALLLTVALASISYRWLETPFLKLKNRYALIASRPV